MRFYGLDVLIRTFFLLLFLILPNNPFNPIEVVMDVHVGARNSDGSATLESVADDSDLRVCTVLVFIANLQWATYKFKLHQMFRTCTAHVTIDYRLAADSVQPQYLPESPLQVSFFSVR